MRQVLFENACGYQVEHWDDVCGVVLQLSIELLIELKQMISIDFKHIHLCCDNALQSGHVERVNLVVL